MQNQVSLQRSKPIDENAIPPGMQKAFEKLAAIWDDDVASRKAFAAMARILRHSGYYDPNRGKLYWTEECDQVVRLKALSFAISRMSDPDLGTAAVNTVLKNSSPPPIQRHQVEINGPLINEVDQKLKRLITQRGFSEEDALVIVDATIKGDMQPLLNACPEVMKMLLAGDPEESAE